MLYTTSTKLHGDVPLRSKIIQVCKKYANEKICTIDKEKRIFLKKKAVFCLEPVGDNPWRKSIIDSITYGCIPVLFSHITDGMAPYHWQGWRNRTRVFVPRWDFMSGRIDLKKLLESIPPSFLQLLQQSIEKIAKRFQTSLQFDPGDSHSFILRGLVDQLKMCEARFHKKIILGNESLVMKKKKKQKKRK
mmetsp:Transcript_39524/g.55076  ORF Transcript_39524/g.55076 Transcript_39524/m.55076 type:complete len:190 (+) Transcript_39524:142-711(+)